MLVFLENVEQLKSFTESANNEERKRPHIILFTHELKSDEANNEILEVLYMMAHDFSFSTDFAFAFTYASEVRKHFGVDSAEKIVYSFGDEKQCFDVQNIKSLHLKMRKHLMVRKIEKIIATQPIVVFMKGSPWQPKCGFSRKTVEIIESTLGHRNFGYFDILEDEELRQALKEYNDWPTYPQIFVNAEFIGGADIISEMNESKTLAVALNC